MWNVKEEKIGSDFQSKRTNANVMFAEEPIALGISLCIPICTFTFEAKLSYYIEIAIVKYLYPPLRFSYLL